MGLNTSTDRSVWPDDFRLRVSRCRDLQLADEPTAALDSQRAKQVMELFAKIAHEQNAGVIVVTHDHRFLDVLDTVYELEDGVLRKRDRIS